ncbi:MAG: DinB family protein [Bacteroidetes bacterium]|nr:DinB family protein [Bacteroidota bacterium]
MNTQQTELIVKMNLSAWESQNKRFSELIEKLSDAQLLSETAPGRNTGVYLLGHIAAVNDDMLRLLGLRDKFFPEYTDIFIKSPDKSGKTFPSVAELKAAYNTVTNELNKHFNAFTTEQWLSKHTAVSEEDFAKEPMRNKLNVMISRTIHLANHMGQLAYLKN